LAASIDAGEAERQPLPGLLFAAERSEDEICEKIIVTLTLSARALLNNLIIPTRCPVRVKNGAY
jgi:hypothetical protein